MSGDTLALPLWWKNTAADGADLYAGRIHVGFVGLSSSGAWLSHTERRFLRPYLSRHATIDEAKAALIAAVKELANG